MRVRKIVGEPTIGELEVKNPRSNVDAAARLSRLGPNLTHTGATLWPIGFFLVLTSLMTFPLVLDLGHSIVNGNVQDAHQNMWNLWWVKTALFERHTNPFYTDMLYYPYRSNNNPLPLYFHTLQPLNMLLAMPLVLLGNGYTGPVLGFNFLVLFGFTFDGCAMFWLVRYLTGSRGAGLVAGILFAYCPLVQNGLHQGQTNLITLGWLPLYLLFLHRLFYAPPNHRRRDFGLVVIFLTATAYTDWYLTLYLLIATGLLTLVLLMQRPRQWWRTLLTMAGIGLAWLVLVAPFLLPTLRATTDNTFQLVGGYDYEVRESLNLWSIFNFFKDTRVTSIPLWQPGTLTWPAVLLGLLGIVAIRRKATFWVLLALTGLVLALGPYLKVTDTLLASETTGIGLPYLWLRQLPFLSIARSPQRFIILTDLALAVLAGVGVAWLLDLIHKYTPRRWPKFKHPPLLANLAVLMIMLVSILELSILPQPINKIEISPFMAKLAAEPGDFAILEIPITNHYLSDHNRMLYQTVHGKKIFGGYISRKVFDYYLDSSSPFRQFIGVDGVDRHTDILPPLDFQQVISCCDIRYVIAYKETDLKRTAAYLHDLIPDPAALVYDDQYLTAYKVTPSPTISNKPMLWVGEGWYPAEMDAKDHNRRWRWSDNQGLLEVVNTAPLKLKFDFSSSTFRGDAHLQVAVDDQPYKTFDLSPKLEKYDGGIIELLPGQHSLKFKSDAPPVSPVQAGASQTDQRALAFVIQDLNLTPTP